MSCALLLLALSQHIGTEQHYNQTHPAVGIECEHITAQVYHNSIKRESIYLAARQEWHDLFIEAGVVTGYFDDILPAGRVGYSMKYLDIFIAPGLEQSRVDGSKHVIGVAGIQFKMPLNGF